MSGWIVPPIIIPLAIVVALIAVEIYRGVS